MATSPLDPSIYHITFLRHGESVGNAEGYHQGQAEFPLTEKGRQQSQALADYWGKHQVSFDKMIASPLSRSRDTAEIINEVLGIPLEFDPLWMERDNGEMAGLTHAVGAERYPRDVFVSLYQPIGHTGETIWELYLRGARAVETILRGAPGRYLIVSHGGLLNMAFHAIMGVIPQPNFVGFVVPLENCAYSTVQYIPSEGQWRFQNHNEKPHLLKTEINAELSTEFHQLTLLRHGESIVNQKKVVQGQADYALSDRGRKQAHLLAARWEAERMSFDEVIASPLKRALETAQIICDKLNLNIETEPDWMEFNWGDLNDLTRDQVEERSDSIQWNNPYFVFSGGGESNWEVYLRAGRNLQKLLNKPPGNYLIVAHGAVLSRFLFAIFGLAPQNRLRFGIENTAFATLRFFPDRHLWVLQGLNDHSHIEKEELQP
jgi:broad specificity phosphatase PhoE